MDRPDKISFWSRAVDFLFNEAYRFMVWAVHLLGMLCTVFVFLLGVYWAVSGFWGPGIITFLLLFYYLCTRDKL